MSWGDEREPGPSDSEPSREPDPTEQLIDYHMGQCGACSHGNPCAVINRIVGVYWR